MDENLEELREYVFAYEKLRNEQTIQKWLDSIGYTEPVGYYRDISNKTMEIYTTRPGILIGKHGVSVYAFQKMLEEEFHGEWKVKFIEIRGGFVNM